jgi:signal transduction histidine kinase/DNA-binding response OmpR family regulator
MSNPSEATDPSDDDDDDGIGRIRPRGWIAAAAVTGALSAAFLFAAALFADKAPYIAAGAMFVGVAVGAVLMRRARDRELLKRIAIDDEHAADRDWQLNDIAEHYRLNAEGRRQAEAASAAKSQFLTHVSHELRTPLGGILGLTEVLMETPLTAEQETFARAVRISGELMLGLVDDILDFAKIEGGRFDLMPREIDIEQTLEEIAELFFNRAESKGLELATYVDPAVPSPISVDPARLRQVLINLIGNALKFTDRGGVAVTAAPDVSDPGRIRIAVEDTGPGISPDDAGRIFGEFERGNGDRRFDGSGLGLTIAQRIIGRMGSQIEVAPRPRGGSIFSFTLAVAGRRKVEVQHAELAGKRVLIIAPGGIAPELVARQIAEHGGTARVCNSFSKAAALAGAATAAGEGYDLMLFDQRAAADPAAAVKTIRDAAGTELPAVIVVSPGRHKAIAKFRGSGFDAYLVRPLRRGSLMRIAGNLVSGDKRFGFDPSDQPPATPAQPVEGSGLRVLLAEDDDINALLLRSMLLRQGHQITEVGDGEAAVRAAAAEPFDFILLDLAMPKMGGIEAARAIRLVERERNAPGATLIAVTADAREESRRAALAAGFDRYLQKPMTPEALRDLLGGAKGANAAA